MEIMFVLLTFLLQFSSQSLSVTVSNPNFDPSELLIYGDAKIVQGDNFLLLNEPIPSSSGLVLLKKPLHFGDSTALMSFSMAFRFSLSTYEGGGIDLVIARTDFPFRFTGTHSFGLSPENRFLRIEFDSVAGMNDSCCLKSVRVTDEVTATASLVLNNGIQLEAIVEYNSSSKLLLVRLKEFGSATHYYKFPTIPIDLLRIWDKQAFFVGIYSSSARSPQKTVVHSASLRERWT